MELCRRSIISASVCYAAGAAAPNGITRTARACSSSAMVSRSQRWWAEPACEIT
jgi:hypothetical protein